MKRKIIKQGHNTLTITIPKKWADEYRLKAGDEITFTERENGFLLTSEKNEEYRKTEINISGMDIPTIWKYFMAIYREGYDEVKILFDPTERREPAYKFFIYHRSTTSVAKRQPYKTPSETVQEIASRFIGFEIIEHHREYCVVKDMVHLSSKEFDSAFRRVLFLILKMSEDVLESIQKDDVQFVRYTNDMDINVDKFHDYTIRVLNKTGFKDARKAQNISTTLFLLEMLADEFKSISNHLVNDARSISVKNIVTMAEATNDQLRDYYDAYYNFDKNKVVMLSGRDVKIYKALPNMYRHKTGKRSVLTDEEDEVLNHFRIIFKIINSLLELRVEMEF